MNKSILTHKSALLLTAGLGMVMAVSGCSSSSDGVTGAAAEAITETFADSATETLAGQSQKTAKLESNGVTLLRSSTPIEQGKTTVALQYTADEVTVTALGKTATFNNADRITEDNGNVYYENKDKGWISLDGLKAEDVAAGKTSYTYMLPVKGGVVGGNHWDRFYAVMGLETTHDVIAKKANATYSGHFSIDSYGINDPVTRHRDHGDVALQADFANSKINGSLTFSPEQTDKLELKLKEADISGNSFASSFAVKDDTEEGSGDFVGKFYGNEGQEAGGTISLQQQETVDGVLEKEVGAGTWVAKQDQD